MDMTPWRTNLRRDRMVIDWDVPIVMDDGVVLRADVYRPEEDGPYPVILTHGPYAKWLHFADAVPYAWEALGEQYPETRVGTTSRYQNWEVVDPERWVPDGYVCIRVDSRGAGRSQGFLDPWSPRETEDMYQCIEWAGEQPWSNGKVGLNGISYYGMNQWQVATMHPPHLAAMCVWEGASDLYRELFYHGGILSTFVEHWYQRLITSRQHGLGERGPRSRLNGEPVTGPDTLPLETLAANRADFWAVAKDHPLFDDYWRERVPDLSLIQVPLLSAGNWGGQGLHLHGNVEGFLGAGSNEKWLEIHGRQHWAHFYTDYGIDLQKRFFGHFLRDEDTGWEHQPRVQLQIRRPGERFETRHEDEWPLARTRWTRLYLHPSTSGLSAEPPDGEGSVPYAPLGDGLTFLTEPFESETELTGPSALTLFISSDTTDADIFVVVRVFTPDLREVTFAGSNDPHTPIAHGWLRASHRKLDPAKSQPHRPVHTHDEPWPLTPGEVTRLDIEIWPTSIIIPEGHRIGLTVRGRDYVHSGSTPQPVPTPGTGTGTAFEGVGPFRHVSPHDRAGSELHGSVRLHWGPDHYPFVVLPVIP